MANKSAVLSFTGESFESVDVELSDSDSWQFIDPSDSDEGNFSYTDDDVADVDDLLYGSPASDISMKTLVDEITTHCQELENVYEINHNRQIIDVLKDDEISHHFQEIDQSRSIINSGDDDEDEEDELDDELVPKWLNNKFQRQRMRKLGKRGSAKMNKSKRIANQINRPGCVHGKHGFGLKHNLMWNFSHLK